MAQENGVKIGYGNYGDINTAIENATLDERDLVITKDTSELVHIRNDKTLQVIRPRILRFDSKEDAITELNKNSDTYAGQPIVIKNDSGKYDPYTVQQGTSAFEVEPVIQVTSGGGMTWVEF